MRFVMHRVVIESTDILVPMFPINSKQKNSLLLSAVRAQPFFDVREGHTWGIGNLIELEEGQYYFRFGRSTRKKGGQLDKDKKLFFETDSSEARYSNGFYDSKYQVLVLETNSYLPKMNTVTKYFEKVLNESMKYVVSECLDSKFHKSALDSIVKVKVIYNPIKFVDEIYSAYSVKRLTVSIRRPNVWDADSDFQMPLSKSLEVVGGDNVKAIFSSPSDMSRERVTQIAVSAASTGDFVSAAIEDVKGNSLKTIRLTDEKYPATIEEDNIETIEEQRSLMKTIRENYEKIRKITRMS
jgi:hypothetical protein